MVLNSNLTSPDEWGGNVEDIAANGLRIADVANLETKMFKFKIKSWYENWS